MLTEDLAIAVCGATRPCPNWRCGPPREGLPRTDDVCPDCQERGFVYILGERARKPCRYAIVRYTPGWGLTMEAVEGYHKFHAKGKCGCEGRGWAPAILLPDGRVDIGLLCDLAEKANWRCTYNSASGWALESRGHEGAVAAPTLLEAVVKALRQSGQAALERQVGG